MIEYTYATIRRTMKHCMRVRLHTITLVISEIYCHSDYRGGEIDESYFEAWEKKKHSRELI